MRAGHGRGKPHSLASSAHLRRRDPHPREADGLRARVLMDEGCEQFNAASRGGDKFTTDSSFRPRIESGAGSSRNPEQPARSRRFWTPAFLASPKRSLTPLARLRSWRSGFAQAGAGITELPGRRPKPTPDDVSRYIVRHELN